jgi:hypothetical protein
MKTTTISSLVLALALVGCEQQTATEKLAAGPMAAPDLTITALSGPASAATGTTISVIHTTKNIGTAPANSSTTKFWLCTNTTVYGSPINQQAVPALAVGVSKTITNTTFIIPTSQPLGTNYIIAVCGFGISELSKANNTNSTPIVITP